MNKKIIIYFVIAIMLICAGVIIAKNAIKDEKAVETSKEYKNETTQNVVNENKVENTLQNEIQNRIEESTTEDEDIHEKKDDETTKNNREKAIEIAKKDWGQDNTVYFSFDSVDENGYYKICVRNVTTTRAIFWYTIDVKEEKIIDD